MENKAIEKAKIYAEKKSSSKMFKDAHERDFFAGYNQAIEDSCFSEMLQKLIDIAFFANLTNEQKKDINSFLNKVLS